MSHIKQLRKFFEQIADISDEDLQELFSVLETRHYPKKSIITKAGEVENNLYFLSKGLVRIFFIKGNKDITFDIVMEGTVTGSPNSFFTRLPSHFSIETLEPVTALAISREKLEKFYSKSRKWQKFGRMVITFFLLKQERDILDKVKYTPRERFFSFVENNPEFIQRVSQKHLASYLGIKPETFTRMKRHLMNSKKHSKPNHS